MNKNLVSESFLETRDKGIKYADSMGRGGGEGSQRENELIRQCYLFVVSRIKAAWHSICYRTCTYYMQTCTLQKIVLQIFLIGHSRSLFPLFSFLLMKLIVNKFGDDWIWTVYLWRQKPPFYQLSHFLSNSK